MIIPDEVHVHQIVLELNTGTIQVHAGLRKNRQTIAKRMRELTFADLSPPQRMRLARIRDKVLAKAADDDGFEIERIVINTECGPLGCAFAVEGRYEIAGGGKTATRVKVFRKEPHTPEEIAELANPHGDSVVEILATLAFSAADESDHRSVVAQIKSRVRVAEGLEK